MADNKEKKIAKNAKKNFFARITDRTKNFFGGLRSELKKVTWLTRDQLKHTTAVVLLIVLGSALMIWVFDTVLSKGLEAIGFYTPKEVPAVTAVAENSQQKPAVEVTAPAEAEPTTTTIAKVEG